MYFVIVIQIHIEEYTAKVHNGRPFHKSRLVKWKNEVGNTIPSLYLLPACAILLMYEGLQRSKRQEKV